jgi:hypothetical protein
MVEAMKPAVCPLLLLFLAFPSSLFAHRLDEYLQATLVAVEPGHVRLQINLTPGVVVADQVLSLLDRNRDGMISTNEMAAYAELLKRDLTLRLDRRELKLKLATTEFTTPAELRAGLGLIQIEFSAEPGSLAAGAHRLTFENRHLSTLSVYLFNAAQPKFATVRIIGQKRSENQSTGEIEFTFRPTANSHRNEKAQLHLRPTRNDNGQTTTRVAFRSPQTRAV